MPPKATVYPTPFPLLAANSPRLCLGMETTSLPTPSREMPPSQRQNQTPLVMVSKTLLPRSFELGSIRRSDTKTKDTKDDVTSTAVNPDSPLIRSAPWNLR